MTFVVFATPRSRTAWLSRFLSYGGWHCGHDELPKQRSLEDVASWFSQPLTGTVETSAAPWWRLVRQMAPNARVVVLRRPIPEILDSFDRLGCGFVRDTMARELRKVERKLDQIVARVPNVLEVQYADLQREDVCAKVFEHCLGVPHNPDWWRHLAPLNIQFDFSAQVRHYIAYQKQLERFRAQAKVRSLALLEAAADRQVPDELTISEEPIERLLMDCGVLAQRHETIVGEHPDDWQTKNWDLMRLLEAADAHQVVTARSNGRLFGYLFTTIGPTIERSGVRSACHHIFHASPEFRGLGRKLLRASEDRLIQKDVDEVFMRAGTRGDGPRLGSVYRRMGAEFEGELFRKRLKGP